ncbi:MAG: cupin domain-containing protein [Polyangia bacterium]
MDATCDLLPSAVPHARADRLPSVLGDMDPETFLRDHWQKRPLLIRQAIADFAGLFAPGASGPSAMTAARDAFLSLATREDVTSRLVFAPGANRRKPKCWERFDGPFSRIDDSTLPKSHWSVLIHGIESLVPGGWELLRRFSFIPSARVDDLMVSYASPGGTVGPHDDLYDVFLLQGPGRRRWQVSNQADRTLDSDAAIKVLKTFVPEEEFLLEPGDVLYLPPGVAHFGVSDEPCFTYSIGFLAPSHRELVQSFLGYLNEELVQGIDPDALYQDPDLRTQADPLALSDAMIDQVAEVLQQVRWNRDTVGDFLGRLLTGRKLPESFAAPSRTLSRLAFSRRLQGHGILSLARVSRGLVRGDCLFLNGESHHVGPQTLTLCRTLVSDRKLTLPLAVDAPTLALLYDFYTAGYLALSTESVR